MSTKSAIALSPLDSERFGVPIARAALVTAADVEPLLRYCGEHGIAMAIVRCAATDLPAMQNLERHGFRLMDTLVHYVCDLGARTILHDAGQVPVLPLRPGEEEEVRKIAREAFGGYLGHYHADPRLDRAQCDATYVDWSERCCSSRDFAQVVLLAHSAGPVGYCALQGDGEQQFDIRLLAVAPAAQHHGVSGALLSAAQHWARARQAKRLTISTQLANVASQRAYIRAGFEPCWSFYTLHKWFQE